MKHKILPLMLFMGIFFAKAQIVSYQLIQSYSVQDIEQLIDDFGATGLLVPQYPVDFYRVLYKTEYNDSMTTVSGAVAIPQNAECKLPIVSYQHGTSSKKTNTPSYDSQEKNILIIFASEGKLLTAPDYIGLGSSNVDIHPYHHSYSQAHSTINLLRAARELQDTFSYDLSDQIFMFGYSQGGHATAATVMYIEQEYSDEFTVTAAMPMSGAYNISGVQTDFIDNGLPYATPGYLPFIFMGYQSVYHDLYDSIQEIFVPPYDSIMPYLLYGHQNSIGYISNQCDPLPLNMLTSQAYNDFQNEPNYPFRVRLMENDLTTNGWVPQTPMRMYYCTADEQVVYTNSLVADSVWNALGAPDVEAVYVANSSHNDCVLDAFIYGKIFLEGKYNNGVGVLLDFDENNNVVSVDVVDDNIDDYFIEWNDGSTGESLSNLLDNNRYSVTLTHKTKGCSNTMSFTKESLLGVAKNFNTLKMQLYPNPTLNYVTINVDFDEEYTVQIFNSLGQLEYEYQEKNNSEVVVDVNNFTTGVYYVVVNGESAYSTSFVKK